MFFDSFILLPLSLRSRALAAGKLFSIIKQEVTIRQPKITKGNDRSLL